MNVQLQHLKDSLYKTWWSEDILFDVNSVAPPEWEAIKNNPSDYFNKYIQRFPLLESSEAIAETPKEQCIWKEVSEEEAKWSLHRIIAISLPYKSEHFPEEAAKQLVDDVTRQFLPSVRYFWPDYRLTYASFEENLVIVDQEKLLFVMRIEED